MKRLRPIAVLLPLLVTGGPLLAQDAGSVGAGNSVSVGGVSASDAETAGTSGGRSGSAGTAGFAGSVSAGGLSASDVNTAGASAADGRAGSSFANGGSVSGAAPGEVGRIPGGGTLGSTATKRMR